MIACSSCAGTTMAPLALEGGTASLRSGRMPTNSSISKQKVSRVSGATLSAMKKLHGGKLSS